MASKVVKKEQTELEKVYGNKYEVFKKILGDNFPEEYLQGLAKSDVHQTEVQKLLDQGCPPKLIAEILL